MSDQNNPDRPVLPKNYEEEMLAVMNEILNVAISIRISLRQDMNALISGQQLMATQNQPTIRAEVNPPPALPPIFLAAQEQVHWIVPSIKNSDFIAGMTLELKNRDWGDMLTDGSGTLRIPWVKWLGNIINHPALIPYWSPNQETVSQSTHKKFSLSKTAKCLISIMRDTMGVTFPIEGEGIIFNGKMLKGSDAPIMTQVKMISKKYLK